MEKLNKKTKQLADRVHKKRGSRKIPFLGVDSIIPFQSSIVPRVSRRWGKDSGLATVVLGIDFCAMNVKVATDPLDKGSNCPEEPR